MAVSNDIAKALSKKLNLPPFKGRAYLRGVTDLIAEKLQEGDRVVFEGLGTFKLTRLPERTVKTGVGNDRKTIKLPATTVPDFITDIKLISELKEALSRKKEQAQEYAIHSRIAKIDFIDLKDKTIPKNVLRLVPEKIARKYLVIPFALEDNKLHVAMVDPENEEAFSAIRKTTGKLIKPFLSTAESINIALDQYSGFQNELKEIIGVEPEAEINGVKEGEKQGKIKEEEIAESSPAAKIVATLLKQAVREKASDIHIEPGEAEVTVRLRVDGMLRKVLTLPKDIQLAVVSRVKILANLKIDETRLPQDGRIQLLLDGNKIDFRISTLPTVNGEKIVARVLDHSSSILTLDNLGLTGRSFKILEENITKAHGMTLVTGPTGSGKSTTLYAIIHRIKNEAINIITMEDPVEYRMSGINQSQANSRINFTFATGLRSILRQDPDVIMVGEIRDKETADIAINAALTGHIVLSSLHTNDAAGALPRLLDMKIEPFLITSSVNAIVAQRLCRKICDKCRQEIKLKIEYQDVIDDDLKNLPEEERSQIKRPLKVYAGKGCETCSNTGYKGRIGIFEVLNVSETIKQLTLKNAPSSEILAAARKEGMITMKQDGILKTLSGLTTIEEVWRVTKD